MGDEINIVVDKRIANSQLRRYKSKIKCLATYLSAKKV